jgi:NitT/TauT family transport system substrate-binding protein
MLKSVFVSLSLALATMQAPPALAKAKKIKVGYSPVVSTAGIFIAMERGYFKEEGLEIEGTPFRASTGPMVGLLARGQLDVGGGNITGGLWNAVAEGAGIRIVADKGSIGPGRGYIALMVRSDHVKSGRYKTFKDLKGFRMALTATGGTSQEVAADRFLQAGGLSSGDVTFLKMSYSDMNAALRSKDLDATVTIEPYVSMAELEKIAVNKGSLLDIYPDQVSAAIFFSETFAKNRKDDAVRFLAAYLRGVRDYNEAFGAGKGRKEIIEILKRHTEATSDDVWARMTPVGLDPDGFLPLSALQQDLDWYKSRKYVPASVSAQDAVDRSLLELALKRIGKHKDGTSSARTR